MEWTLELYSTVTEIIDIITGPLNKIAWLKQQTK